MKDSRNCIDMMKAYTGEKNHKRAFSCECKVRNHLFSDSSRAFVLGLQLLIVVVIEYSIN